MLNLLKLTVSAPAGWGQQKAEWMLDEDLRTGWIRSILAPILATVQNWRCRPAGMSFVICSATSYQHLMMETPQPPWAIMLCFVVTTVKHPLTLSDVHSTSLTSQVITFPLPLGRQYLVLASPPCIRQLVMLSFNLLFVRKGERIVTNASCRIFCSFDTLGSLQLACSFPNAVFRPRSKDLLGLLLLLHHGDFL